MLAILAMCVFALVSGMPQSWYEPVTFYGQPVFPHEFPATVSVQIEVGKWFHKCSGVLVSSMKVLTAAHCRRMSSETPMRVIFGAHRLSNVDESHLQMVPVVGELPHPDYSGGQANDIMLLWLKRAVEVQAGEVEFVRLPRSPVASRWMSTKCTMLGWDAYAPTDSKRPDAPMKTEVIAHFQRRENKLYIATMALPMVKTCVGDSSGPVYCPALDGGKPFFAGMKAGRPGVLCGSADMYELFTRIDQYYDWIAHE